MLPLAGHSRICQEIKQKIKWKARFWVVKLNCALKISRQPAIPQFVRVIPYNFLHQVELIIRGLDQLVLSPMNKTHLF
jgi:hypothetical protein